MDDIKNRISQFAEKMKKVTDNRPTDKWKCKECGAINNNWIPLIMTGLNGDVKYRKGLCSNCEKIRKARELERARKEKMLQDNLKIKELLKFSQIPYKIKSSNFKNLEIRKGAEKAFRIMQRLEHIDRWIYIYGANNTGKSQLVGAAINRAAKMFIPCVYFNESLLFTRIKESYNNHNNESYYSILESIQKAKVIFWDDFSATKYTDHEWKLVQSILEICDSKGIFIVFTSNLDLKNSFSTPKGVAYLEERIGVRSLNRIKRNNVFYVEMKNDPFF